MGLGELPEWASPALQGLAYWLGYQDAYGIADRLSEGAIATEFLRLMVAHREAQAALEPEVLYRHIPELTDAPGIAGSSARADFVITDKTRKDRNAPFQAGSVHAIIEVKHGRSQVAKVWEDIQFLSDQRAASNKRIRGFLIYASIGRRPRFTDESGAAPRPRVQSSPRGARYVIRRVCRATSIIPSKNVRARGCYAILIEVT